jgi:hypothetical protein
MSIVRIAGFCSTILVVLFPDLEQSLSDVAASTSPSGRTNPMSQAKHAMPKARIQEFLIRLRALVLSRFQKGALPSLSVMVS